RLTCLRSGQPAAFYFAYRESPQLFDPLAMTTSIADLGRVTPTNPPSIRPGMVTVGLDMKGRLLSFRHVPPFRWPEGSGSQEEALETLSSAAGLDMKQFAARASDWTPPVYCDQRMTWEGVFPEAGDIPLRIEAGTWKGSPVYFELLGPWTMPHEVDADPRSKDLPALDAAGELALSLLLLLAGGVLALRNWRLGYADTRGAFRLAGYIFAINLLAWTLNADHVF